MVINGVRVTERGWAGHFCCSQHCKFRRNTLLEWQDKMWIVSTVGDMIDPLTQQIKTIGYDRWYETMVFVGAKCGGYIDADVSREIPITSDCGIYAANTEELKAKYPNADNDANDMHERVVAEMIEKIRR